MQTLTNEEIKNFAESLGNHEGVEIRDWRPEGRTDVSIVRWTFHMGNGLGMDRVFILGKIKDGRVCRHELASSFDPADWIEMRLVEMEGDDLIVKLHREPVESDMTATVDIMAACLLRSTPKREAKDEEIRLPLSKMGF